MHPEMSAHGSIAVAGLPTDTTARRLACVLVASVLVHALLLLLPVMPAGSERVPGAALDVQLHAGQRVTAAAADHDAIRNAAQAMQSQSEKVRQAAAAHDSDVSAPREPATPQSARADASVASAAIRNVFDQDTIDTESSSASAAGVTNTSHADAAAEKSPVPPAPVAISGGELAFLCPNQKPDYPALSRRLQESGFVELNVHVGNDGRVNSAWVRRTSGSPRLDRAAIAEVMSWKCNAPERNGARVDVVAVQQFTFSLN